MEKNTVEESPRLSSLMPLGVFVVFYLGLSICKHDFYGVSLPVAFIVASAAALLQNGRRTLSEKVDIFARSMGDGNIMIMCLVFILAGMFAATAKAAGSVEAAVLIARHLIPENLILLGVFLVSCVISLAIGTSCGTIAALTPIALGLTSGSALSPAMMVGAVIGGAMFGDNMSMISDTTIAATRTQNVEMRDKFLMNIKMVLPAAVAAVIFYIAAGRAGAGSSVLAPVTWREIVNIVPYIVILIGALIGFNVMALLFGGTVLAAVLGIVSGVLEPWKALQVAGDGSLGMSETLIVALLSGGLLGVIRANGGIEFLLKKISLMVKSRRGCEFGVALLVSVVNLFTANNTVAIVIAGPIARDMSLKYSCDPRRIASILDAASCVIQGIIPYGAQILIAVGIAKEARVKLASLELITLLIYPMFLGLALLTSILFSRKRN
ncbi:MAG: Na+/H+ antiporter NhaC family protein [Lentisphaeria bacterium]|nr:Na+/H+ antiporter NhaC family protein [Lentisphaeria bacterium]